MKLLKKSLILEFAIPLKNEENKELLPVIENCLNELGNGIEKFDVNTTSNPTKVVVQGTVPPSELFQTLKKALGGNVPVVLRGQSSLETHKLNSAVNPMAAVCIFEHYKSEPERQWAQYDNCGLARLVQIDDETCLIDVALHGWTKASLPCCGGKDAPTHVVELHTFGDISSGASSVGQMYPNSHAGMLGQICISKCTGTGSLVVESSHVSVGELIGRSIVVRPIVSAECTSRATAEQIACGVIARSAGLFQNEKVVCSCSGKTLWAEAKEIPQR